MHHIQFESSHKQLLHMPLVLFESSRNSHMHLVQFGSSRNSFICTRYSLKGDTYNSCICTMYSFKVHTYNSCICTSCSLKVHANNSCICTSYSLKVIIIIIIKRDWQCKAGREQSTPYQSEDPSPTTPTLERKKRKGKQ